MATFTSFDIGFLLANLQSNLRGHFYLRFGIFQFRFCGAQLGAGRINIPLRGCTWIDVALALIISQRIGSNGTDCGTSYTCRNH